jgi:hypothetical protein
MTNLPRTAPRRGLLKAPVWRAALPGSRRQHTPPTARCELEVSLEFAVGRKILLVVDDAAIRRLLLRLLAGSSLFLLDLSTGHESKPQTRKGLKACAIIQSDQPP